MVMTEAQHPPSRSPEPLREADSLAGSIKSYSPNLRKENTGWILQPSSQAASKYNTSMIAQGLLCKHSGEHITAKRSVTICGP